LERLRTSDDLLPAYRVLPYFMALATEESWDIDSRDVINKRLEHVERTLGSTFSYIIVANFAEVAWQRGDADGARARYDEMSEMMVTQAKGAQTLPGADVQWLAWQGAERETQAAAQAHLGAARISGHAQLADHARLSLGILDNGFGRYRSALTHLMPLFEEDPFPYGTMALPELVEAGARGGDRGLAMTASARLSERAAAFKTPWALGLAARSAALLDDRGDTDDLFREALSSMESVNVVTDVARTHLLYGEWLRRRRRRHEARRHLRTAHEQFSNLRCVAFAERARQELLATGEHARVRTPETVDILTPREAQIARMAARRATNAEIAAQLFISESTVAYHLRKIFRKLGVTSRRELSRGLAPQQTDAAPSMRRDSTAPPG
jgi:DNA-binding CsgD family transcriptional regulator